MSWTKAQERDFLEMLLALGEVFNEPVSTVRGEMFLRLVEDLPFTAVRDAAASYARSAKFFPKPGDLRELIEGNAKDLAEQAEDQASLRWEWLIREVRRVGWTGTPAYPDEATKRAAEGLFGGWRALCESLPASGPELLGFRKQFVAVYVARAREAMRGELGPGRDEARALLEDLKTQLKARGLPAGE